MSKKHQQEKSGEPATTPLDPTEQQPPQEFPRDHVKDPKTEPRNPQPDTVPQQQQPGQEAIPQETRQQVDPGKTYVFTSDANHGIDGKRHTFKAGDEAKGLSPDDLAALLSVGLIKEKDARPEEPLQNEPLFTEPLALEPETPQIHPGL